LWEKCGLFVLGGSLLNVRNVGLSFPVFDIGVYEAFVDGKCGGWELVETVL
jgi:hypothetical protein